MLCLEGEIHTELEDGRIVVLKAGMSYQVADGEEPHRSRTANGARLSSWIGAMEGLRDEMRRMAAESIAQGDATGWFDCLYLQAGGDWICVPWADCRPEPLLVAWPTFGASPMRKRCLVVGCGLGDDAEALASGGFAVTAFDISPTAIAAARRRFPHAPASTMSSPTSCSRRRRGPRRSIWSSSRSRCRCCRRSRAGRRSD